MDVKNKPKENKPSPPTSGIAIAGAFWIWGFILLYTPPYLGIIGVWKYPFYVLGFIGLTISLAGALIELGKLRHSEGLSNWGASIVFLLPALALYLLVKYQHIAGALVIPTKIAILLLVAMGVPFIFLGISYFFWKKEIPELPQKPFEQIAISRIEKAKPTLKVIANIIVAMLALATAIVTLVEKIIP